VPFLNLIPCAMQRREVVRRRHGIALIVLSHLRTENRSPSQSSRGQALPENAREAIPDQQRTDKSLRRIRDDGTRALIEAVTHAPGPVIQFALA
jgi:hypothetical protein